MCIRDRFKVSNFKNSKKSVSKGDLSQKSKNENDEKNVLPLKRLFEIYKKGHFLAILELSSEQDHLAYTHPNKTSLWSSPIRNPISEKKLYRFAMVLCILMFWEFGTFLRSKGKSAFLNILTSNTIAQRRFFNFILFFKFTFRFLITHRKHVFCYNFTFFTFLKN